MLDFDAARDVTIDDIAKIGRRIAALDDDAWSAVTRLPGWTVRELVGHLTSSEQCQGEAVRNLLAGSAETPAVRDFPIDEPDKMARRLTEEGERITEALRAIEPAHLEQIVPLPFGSMPTAIGIYVMMIEYAWHRNDLEWALDGEVPLDPEVASTYMQLVPGFLPGLATTSPDTPFAYEIASATAPFSVVPADSGWTIGDPGTLPRCVIAGDDSALGLFTLGRIPADHPSLTVSGDAASRAGEFKTWFPGP